MAGKTVIHVHQQRIRKNIRRAAEEREPPVIVLQGASRRYASDLIIAGPCRVVYSPDKPLACGARLWIETDSAVEIVEHDNGG